MDEGQGLALAILILGAGALLFLLVGRQASPALARPRLVPLPASTYENEEVYDIERDKRGFPTRLTVHRSAHRVDG